jgi:biopolymer transport protein ExbB
MLQAIKAFALMGGEWVLFLLLALSLWCVAVIWDRAWFFRSREKGARRIHEELPGLLARGELKQALEIAENSPSTEGAVLKAGLSNLSLGPEAVELLLESQRIQERLALEKNLLVLGTLGNNAPFIGLFGTVLGIIKAFNDLSIAGTSGSSAVMRGVSEALVATAVGLLIAIPAVASFNYFQGRIKLAMANTDRLCRMVLAYSRKGGKK